MGAAPTFPTCPQETWRVQASDGAQFDYFAFELDVDGPLAIVGADSHDAGLEQGAAYVLDWATGSELQKLLPSSPSPWMAFGWDVAMSGTTALVGAPYEDAVAASSGRVYVFDLLTGTETAILEAEDASFGARFGNAVDIDGNYALIGAPGDTSISGAGYLFDLTTGTQLFKWVPSDAVPFGFDGYGFRVAIDGNYGVVAQVESVAVFDVTTGSELYLLDRPGVFGRSVAAKDGLLVVGAPSDGELGSLAGAAYVFDLATGTELAKLLAYDGAPNDYMGVGVDISENYIATGAFNSNVSGFESGVAYLYDRSTFEQVARLVPSDGEADNRFGRTVAINGESLFVSAVGFDNRRGAAYRFDVPTLDPGSPSCFGRSCPCGTDDPSAGCPNATGGGALMTGSGSASLAVDDLTLSTSMLPANQFGIYFMGNQHTPASPLGNGLLCTGGDLFRYPVQNTGSGTADLGSGIAATTCASFPATGCITAGSSWTFQFWYRDGGSSCPATSNSSNAWTVLFTP